MKRLTTGNMLVSQSGGPTVVINQSLAGAVIEAKKHGQIGKIYGSLHGIKGVLNENFIDLSRENISTLEAVAATPSSALGTVRHKPKPEECKQIFLVLKKYDIKYFFYIGGNDSAETTQIISEQARLEGADLKCFHIPKTIDNDLRENDHTPGFGSAARFVALALMGDNLDNRALPGVKIDVVMGRHAGFLTAASALGRVYPDDGPHLVYVPERPFSMDQFLKDVKLVYDKLGRCIVAVSEGISDDKGRPIIEKFTKEVDSHGNVQLSGTGALGDLLSSQIKEKLKISRVRADTFGYIQRSFPGVVSTRDAAEARAVGAAAVKEAMRGTRDGSIAICRKPGSKYAVTLKRVALENVARKTKSMPPEFINKEGNNVTDAFIKYALPLLGDMPKIRRLNEYKVAKKA